MNIPVHVPLAFKYASACHNGFFPWFNIITVFDNYKAECALASKTKKRRAQCATRIAPYGAKMENGIIGMAFMSVVLIEARSDGKKYTAIAVYKDVVDAQQHKEIEFYEVWGAALDN
ncbi:MAG: hypothetical protein H0W44_09395 [Gammaproteobacteria bacterium]|nr:hypothetical protein [Gammaproteobacteria bacterium]